MDVSYLLDSLNTAQREAVTDASRHALVLAGAGSGKTRVLTHRIAWLNKVDGISAFSVLAVTFTNKAANEMRERVGELLSVPTKSMWVGTFHGLAHRLLRLHWSQAGLPQNFQILDADDQLRIVKRIVKNLELDESQWPPKVALWYINARKDEGQRPQHIDDGDNPIERQHIAIYSAYEVQCRKNGSVDFAELLLRAHELLRDNPALLAHYQKRFTHILVDEFQDSNTIQYAWIKLLVGQSGSLFAVGDDDQSIYAWRGAQVENMFNVSRDFSNVKTIRLEQNYRSTGNILAAANALIGNNDNRLGKELWTAAADGELITIFSAFNEQEEANFVVDKIRHWVSQGGQHSECAILYRSNVLSRVLETAFVRAEMPYRVYGGMRFFERIEIKDALAYLRLIGNRHEDIAFERVVNQPTRGIGERTISIIRDAARDGQVSMWQASQGLISTGGLKGRAASAVQRFIDLINTIAEACTDQPLNEIVSLVINQSTLKDYFSRDKTEKGQSRLENLEELIGAANAFVVDETDEFKDLSPLDQFLSQAALEAGDAQGQAWEDCVQMMTLHSAKGLEFPVVFMVGMEEGIFPSERSQDEARLDEERRLCYVGITRARQKLILSNTEQRRLYGRDNYNRPSRFIKEIPTELLDEVRPKITTSPVGQFSQPSQFAINEAPDTGFSIGQSISHPTFGIGLIINFEGQGNSARVQVNFEEVGSKWLVLAYAKLAAV